MNGVAAIVVLVSSVSAATAMWGSGTDMVTIPAGPAILGGENSLGMEGPRSREVASFEIDRFEVTNSNYAEFVKATGAAPPAFFDDEEFNAPDQPVTGVQWAQAVAYCHWRGKRLPTEVEWEKAARGADGRLFPWGNGFDARLAHLTGNAPVAVTADAGDVSPYGVRAMAGNVSEWVADTRIAEGGVCGAPHVHGAAAPSEPEDPALAYFARLSALQGQTIALCRNPDLPARFNPVEPCAFIKGNSFAGLPHMTRLDNRMWDYTNSYAEFVGFRCARDAGGT